jgi:hypothetical protein
MSGIFFLESVDEVLEAGAVPFAPHTLHDADPVGRPQFAVLRQLVDASSTFIDGMLANEISVSIIKVQMAAYRFIVDFAEAVV